MLSKSLIQFYVDGWGCVPSLLFDLRPNYGGGNEDNGDLFQKSHARTATLSVPYTAAGHRRPTPLLEIPGCSQSSLGQSLMGSLPLSPGSWCVHNFVCALQECSEPYSCLNLHRTGGAESSEGRQNENHNHRKLIKLITWITALSNSMKL